MISALRCCEALPAFAGMTIKSELIRTSLKLRSEPARLGDGAFGIEFGRHVRASDQVHAMPGRLQRRQQVAPWLLAGADHDVLDRQQLRLAVHAQVEAFV